MFMLFADKNFKKHIFLNVEELTKECWKKALKQNLSLTKTVRRSRKINFLNVKVTIEDSSRLSVKDYINFFNKNFHLEKTLTNYQSFWVRNSISNFFKYISNAE